MSTTSKNSSESSPLIVVVGATGNQGGSVIEYLLQQQGSKKWRIRGLCRNTDTEKAKELIQRGVELYKCDISDKDQVIQAFKGAYGVFGVTVNQEDVEVEQGKNLVDAALQNNVQHFVWSSLDDVKSICGRNVPHFTDKNKVEQYAREKKDIPFVTFVYGSSFFENFFRFFQIDEDKSQGVLSFGADEDVKIPMFSVLDIGISVVDIFNHPEKYNRKKVLVASELLTASESADIFSKALGIPTSYHRLDYETIKKIASEELAEMFEYFNITKGYYWDNQEEAYRESKTAFPQLSALDQWIVNNKEALLNVRSFKPSA